MKHPVRHLLALVAAAFVVFGGASPASAHDATDGSVTVVVDDDQIVVTAPVAFAELGFTDTSGDGLIDATELGEQQADIASTLVDTVRQHVSISVDGDDIDIVGAGIPAIAEVGSDHAGASDSVVLVIATDRHDGDVGTVALDYTFDAVAPTVVLSHADGAITGDLSEDGTVEFSLGSWASAVSFFELGIEHIRFGPDHLLFLLVLTLAVAGTTVSKQTTRRTVELVTAFTLGHALSLCLAYFDLITVPAWIVEPAISLSIVGAAILAIRGNSSDARPWIAAVIGVVHGLGFASSLSGLGVVASQRITALAAFNLGIDVAQTAVVLLILGGLWAAGQVTAGRIAPVRIAGAGLAAVFGIAWTATRLAELPV